CNLGHLIKNSGQAEKSLEWYQKAITTLEPLEAMKPPVALARLFLFNSHHGRAVALTDLDRYAEATRDWERALELDEGPRKVLLRMKLAGARIRVFRDKKDAAGCLATATEYETLKLSDAGAFYNAARYRGICANVIARDPKTPASDADRLVKEQADLAMTWLSKAVAAGFKDTAFLTKDPGLDALRGREDFKKLLAEVEAKQKKPPANSQ